MTTPRPDFDPNEPGSPELEALLEEATKLPTPAGFRDGPRSEG